MLYNISSNQLPPRIILKIRLISSQAKHITESLVLVGHSAKVIVYLIATISLRIVCKLIAIRKVIIHNLIPEEIATAIKKTHSDLNQFNTRTITTTKTNQSERKSSINPLRVKSAT